MEVVNTTVRSEEGIRQYILARLPDEPHSAQEFASKSTFDLLLIFLDWSGRLVSALPRRVHCSEPLLKNPLFIDKKYKPAIDKIINDLQFGNSIIPHLSERIQYAYKEPPATPKSQPRKTLDGLLNDWGIHHLHLSIVPKSNGFMNRSNDLLFVALQHGDAYLINILGHQSWTDVSLCEIMVRQWPNANLLHEINGLTGENLINEERKALRNSNINVCLSIDGKSYFPKGLMSSGHSIPSVRQAQQMLNAIKTGGTVCFSEVHNDVLLKNTA